MTRGGRRGGPPAARGQLLHNRLGSRRPVIKNAPAPAARGPLPSIVDNVGNGIRAGRPRCLLSDNPIGNQGRRNRALHVTSTSESPIAPRSKTKTIPLAACSHIVGGVWLTRDPDQEPVGGGVGRRRS